MLKNRIVFFLPLLLIVLVAGTAHAKKKNVIESFGGVTIGNYGLAVDASHDPKLDDLVPGYNVLNVAFVNNSFNIIELNPQKDKWWISTGSKGKKHQAIADLRTKDVKTWNNLSDRVKNLIAYPLALPIGARQIVDVFVPDNIPIAEFTELYLYIHSLDTTFKIIARQ